MILNYLLNRMDGGNSRPVPNWTRMMRTILNRTDHYTDRAMHGVLTPTPWSVLIQHMLAKVPRYLASKDDVRVMAEVMGSVRDLVEMDLAPGSIIQERDACFTASNNGSAKEIIVPCESDRPLSSLPIGQPIDKWGDVHPIRIIYIDSLEIPMFTGHRFVYSDDPPDEAIITVNIPALILKWVAYMKDASAENASPRQFIHEHLLDNLYEDVIRCWVFRAMEERITAGGLQFYTDNAIAAASVVDLGLKDLDMMTTCVETRTFYVKDFFASFLLTWSCPTIQEYVSWFDKEIRFPDQRKVAYIQFLAEFPLVRILMKLNLLSDTVNSRRLIKDVGIQLKRYRMADILSGCHRANLRKRLSGQLDELIDLSEKTDQETESPRNANEPEEVSGSNA